MTDQQTYTDETARTGLAVAASRDAAFVRTFPLADSGKGVPVMVPTLALLAMIDRAAPEMMRAYLRERSDLMDSPDESCSTLEDMLPADLAVEAARYRIDAVPEAGAPEDVDERVPAREALLTDAQERRLYLIEQLTKTLPAEESLALAHWIITGGMDVIEDLTLSGESLNR